MSKSCILNGMSKSTSDIARIPFELPATHKAELVRLARKHDGVSVNALLRRIVREWIASENATEAADAQEANAA